MSAEIFCADVICIKNFLNEGELELLENDAYRLQQLCHHLQPDSTGAALDPFEFTNIAPIHHARTNIDEYINLRISSGMPRELTSIFQTLLFDRLPRILRVLLGMDLSLPLFAFNEHFIVKDAESQIAFRWHKDIQEQLSAVRDSESMVEYYSCWCAIDDVSPWNGTIAFPTSTCIGIADTVCEESLKGSLRRVYNIKDGIEEPAVPHEDERGKELTLPSGSIAFFSHNIWHRSGVNLTTNSRRVYYVQYSTSPITVEGQVLSFAVPC